MEETLIKSQLNGISELLIGETSHEISSCNFQRFDYVDCLYMAEDLVPHSAFKSNGFCDLIHIRAEVQDTKQVVFH